mmetsp:Transcript_27665/g.39273  ORF Transcript_27665/g.39273 Transcript_27665/m.39273 type:complete len:89 (-) Transcript_27665:169-435(-)
MIIVIETAEGKKEVLHINTPGANNKNAVVLNPISSPKMLQMDFTNRASATALKMESTKRTKKNRKIFFGIPIDLITPDRIERTGTINE